MAIKKGNRPETNTERLTRFMEYSKTGPLMQGFIMSAILEKAQAVKEQMDAKPELFDADWIVSPKAWYACAAEIVATWNKTYQECADVCNASVEHSKMKMDKE